MIMFTVIFSSKKNQANMDVSTACPSKLNETLVGRMCCMAKLIDNQAINWHTTA